MQINWKIVYSRDSSSNEDVVAQLDCCLQADLPNMIPDAEVSSILLRASQRNWQNE